MSIRSLILAARALPTLPPMAGGTWIQSSSPSALWHRLDMSSDGTRAVAGSASGHLYTSFDAGQTWTLRLGGHGQGVACSGNGMTLIGLPTSAAPLRTSTDFGFTWQPTGPSTQWSDVTVSDDGVKIIASEYFGGIYISTNFGSTWSKTGPNEYWKKSHVLRMVQSSWPPAALASMYRLTRALLGF